MEDEGEEADGHQHRR